MIVTDPLLMSFELEIGREYEVVAMLQTGEMGRCIVQYRGRKLAVKQFHNSEPRWIPELVHVSGDNLIGGVEIHEIRPHES